MITNKIFSLLLNASTALVLNVLPAQADNLLPAWAFGGFERPEGVNRSSLLMCQPLFLAPCVGIAWLGSVPTRLILLL